MIQDPVLRALVDEVARVVATADLGDFFVDRYGSQVPVEEGVRRVLDDVLDEVVRKVELDGVPVNRREVFAAAGLRDEAATVPQRQKEAGGSYIYH